MTRAYLLLILYCIAKPALTEPDLPEILADVKFSLRRATWLMQGDMLTEDEATSRLIQLDTYNGYFPVSTRAEVYHTAPPGKLISCVIAAAVYQNGYVSVVEGGYRTRTVRIRYVTKNSESDIFAVFLQTAKKEIITVDGNFVNSTRIGIVSPANWTQQEVENILRNVSANFPFL